MSQNSCIKDFVQGTKVKNFFICSEIKVKESKTGDKFADITLTDKTGELNLKIWNYSAYVAPWLVSGCIVFVSGAVVKEYNGALQISFDSNLISDMIRLASHQEVDMSFLLKATNEDVGALTEELREIIESVSKQPIKCILNSLFFNDEEFMARFTLWPAAVKHHHAYAGGLLEHTIGVARICIMTAGNYSAADKDILIAGALIHDIGKAKSYDYDMSKGTITVSPEGLMADHIQLGVDMLVEKANNMCNMCPKRKESCTTLTKDMLLHLKHLILSHHGVLEWGSPVQPATIEATILHFADNMDAQVNKFQRVISECQGTPYAGNFKFIDVLGRSVFIPDKSEE